MLHAAYRYPQQTCNDASRAIGLQLLCAAGEVKEEDAGGRPAQPLCSRAAVHMAHAVRISSPQPRGGCFIG